MSTTYRAIHWNPQKYRYDAAILFLLMLAVSSFASISMSLYPGMTIETLMLRGSAFLSLFVMQLILCIGPLARLNPRFLPLLYNRRHLGVFMFFLALIHAGIATIQHHALGDLFPLVSLFSSYAQEFSRALAHPTNLANVPFEPFGAAAMVILYLMAATSHDFWLRLLGSTVWKSLHMLVYFAYAAILLHVALGFLQAEFHVAYPVFVLSGAALVFGLHLAAFLRGRRPGDSAPMAVPADGFVRVCLAEDLREDEGKTVRVGKRRIALYRRQGRVFALSNVCRHQGGPIGEGRIVDGCITCPWHGWQYRPEDGASPPPFNEKIPTFPVAVRDGQVYVNPEPLPQGTVSEGALLSGSAGRIDRAAMERASAWFYIGYRKTLSPAITHFVQTSAVIILLACPLFMAVMAAAQHHPDYGTFEFGQAYTLEGVLYAEPVPSLYVRPTTGGAGYHLLLCGQGKFGIPASWHGHHGQKVSLRGTPIYRDNVAMIEAGPEQDLQVLGAPSAHEERPESEDLGLVTLVGELVDTKCYLGVMRPATGKVHRACAIRCLSGGVPPGIRIQAYGRETVLLLAGPAEKALEYDVTWAGRLIEVEGSLQRQDGFSFVRVSRMSLLEAPAGA